MPQSDSREKRLAELARLRRQLPPCPLFEKWLAETGELPPDFDEMPVSPWPQELLVTMRDGRAQRIGRADWPARRQELRRLVETWLLGSAPPPPGNVRGVVENRRQEGDIEAWTVRLEFGPDHAAKLHCWLWVPPHQDRRLPVFMVDNARYTRFARAAMENGAFAICQYNATDPVYVAEKKDQSEAYKDLFGRYDWSEFRRRGWSASRVADWLSTLDFIDPARIFIGGHSRSAKQSLACAAFDDRIAGVIASSPGSGGSLHFRYCDQYYFGESIELLTRVFPYWVSPRVRFFTGRENRLPADFHMVYALIAPRPLLMSTAIHDTVENTFAVERMYESTREIYALLGAEHNLGLRYRPGPHAPDDATYLDHSRFLMLAAEGRSIAEAFPYRPYHPWNYKAWAAAHAPAVDVAAMPERAIDDPTADASGKPVPSARWPQRVAEIRAQVQWLLGDGPAYEKVEPRAETVPAGAAIVPATQPRRVRCRLGHDITGDIYYPPAGARRTAALPGAVWLAPLHTATGYIAGYRAGEQVHLRLSRAGLITLAFDPIGTGGRQEERRVFYDTHPRWSLMGKMVLDARHAIDALLAAENVDPSRIFLVGFGMGGMTALFTAALDERVRGVACVAGFTPFRTDTDAAPTGGMRRWSHFYGWLPRLGLFAERPAKAPVDFAEIIAAIAPRPVLIIAPTDDWHANHKDVVAAVEQARKAYALAGAAGQLTLSTPERWCEFNNDMQTEVVNWINSQPGTGATSP